MSPTWKEWAAAAKPARGTPWSAPGVDYVVKSGKVSKPRKPAVPVLPEWLLQSYLIAEFNKCEAEGYDISAVGDMNAGRRSYQEAAKCKAAGLKAGEPDIRLYSSNGRTLFIEVKTTKGRTSPAQDERHTRLGQLGFVVLVVTPVDEQDARAKARAIANKFADPAGGLI